ncbi:MAG TPA: type II toxin-antitoxin system PemK/MazF family toxin [Bryobacteraceae bacterium]|nr:type II toxin-antitoxin system PemK/MazF family toxin [Bryobacteraceae bacterium]
MPSTITYRRGQVVIVNIPFTGQGGVKSRPALVLSATTFHRGLPDLIVCPISSQPRFFSNPGTGDHPLQYWKSIGLLYPSTARLSNLMAVEKRIVKRVLGMARAADLAQIERGLREVFDL